MSDNNLFDDSLFDDFEEEVPPFEADYSDELEMEESGGAPRPGGNRTFIVIIGIIFAFFILIGGAIAAYVLLIAPRTQAKTAQQAALINAQNTATSVAATEQSMLAQLALTPRVTPFVPTATEEPMPPTPTVVVIIATSTSTPLATEEITVQVGDPDYLARTQTVQYLLDLNKTLTTTPSALPTSGFADDVGLPGLFMMALLLVGVIFLARRLRSASHTAS